VAEYQFTVRLNRAPSAAEADLLLRELGDVGVSLHGPVLDVTRDAPSPADAVESVCADVAKVAGLRVWSVSEVTRA
jgi:hypothetical protein